MKTKAKDPAVTCTPQSVQYTTQAANSELFAFTVRLKPAAEHLCIPLGTMRDLKFYSEERITSKGQTIPGNGFAPAFLKIGRAVYVDIQRFCAIVRSKNAKGDGHV